MPNSTLDIVSNDMQLNATTAPSQIIFIGEFRNQLKIGFKNQQEKCWISKKVIYCYDLV